MQEKVQMSRNELRAAKTQASLMDAAKTLFIKQGYAETGTPEIVRAAGVTRGALYHHFDGKAGLLRAIIMREMAQISGEIRSGAGAAQDAEAALSAGAEAYFRAMDDPGRQRLILRDGPAVLGPDEMARIDVEAGAGGLAKGLAEIMGPEAPERAVIDALADMLSAGFDRAAQRGATEAYRKAIGVMMRGLSSTARH